MRAVAGLALRTLYVGRDAGGKKAPHAGLIHPAGGSLREEKWEGCKLGGWGLGWLGPPRSVPVRTLGRGPGNQREMEATPKWEATEMPLILGASPFHPHLGSYPAGERLGVWVPYTGRKVS